MLKKNIYAKIILISILYSCNMSNSSVGIESDVTEIKIGVPQEEYLVDSMIYGQMLEFCNDRIIYDGIVNIDGSARPHVDEFLKELDIPVVRWPAGTYIFEFNWKNSIGSVEDRPITENKTWGGENNNRFGTDEFMAWTRRVRTSPYFNLNMGMNPNNDELYLKEAKEWIEYVNGNPETKYGRLRAENGNVDSYGVKYWGIGNENYGGFGISTAETSEQYSERLVKWTNEIRSGFPDLSLLGVGHFYEWDSIVLIKNRKNIDFLTHHYYVNSKYIDDSLIEAKNSLFAPAVVEMHLKKLQNLITNIANPDNRSNEPKVRFSVDEWDNRHQVFDGDKFVFTRQAPRRLSDATIAAQMLNVFINQSPFVGMANYIFPVNAHGLLRTVGDTGVYKTPNFYIFEQYRKWMIGKKANVEIVGPGIRRNNIEVNLSGDASELNLVSDTAVFNFINSAATIDNQGNLNISIVNRSPDLIQKFKLNLPINYKVEKIWKLENKDINAANTNKERYKVLPRIENYDLQGRTDEVFEISPCGIFIIQCKYQED